MLDKYFEHYNEICDDIKSMINELKYKKEELYNLSGIDYSDIKTSKNVPVGLDFYIDAITELEDKIQDKIKEKKIIYDDNLQLIEQLEHKDEKDIIRLFFLERLSNSQISTIMYISERH